MHSFKFSLCGLLALTLSGTIPLPSHAEDIDKKQLVPLKRVTPTSQAQSARQQDTATGEGIATKQDAPRKHVTSPKQDTPPKHVTSPKQELLAQQAERMGRIHAAAIYCGKSDDAHNFGVDAMGYFERRGIFEKMREIYGLALVNAGREPPASDIGGNCENLLILLQESWKNVLEGRKPGRYSIDKPAPPATSP